MKLKYILIFISSSYFGFIHCQKLSDSPANIIRSYGYPVEEHTVETEDGYLLQLYRISHGTNKTNSNGKVALLHHGLGMDGACFIILNPKRSLGYILADTGYDVWLLNARGTELSNKHKYISKENKKHFYNFSWHEIGLYDIPATIDYILNKTNQTQLHYVGHSQGCATILITCSLRPEYNSKISLASLLAPAVFMGHVDPLFTFISTFRSSVNFISDTLNLYDLSNFIESLRNLLHMFCSLKQYYTICTYLYNLFGGFDDPIQMDPRIYKDLFRVIPSNLAIKQVQHYFQAMNSGKFQHYDYGQRENLIIYNSSTPPEYNLKYVTIPVALYGGPNDHFANPDDVRYLSNVLRNVTKFMMVKFKYWNHGDFLFATDVSKLLYEHVINHMALY